MAEVGWDDVTYLRKKNPKAAEARSNKVFRFFIIEHNNESSCSLSYSPFLFGFYFSCLSWGFSFLAPAIFFGLVKLLLKAALIDYFNFTTQTVTFLIKKAFPK